MPPQCGASLVFTNRAGTRIKVLLWDGNGDRLSTWRLLRGQFNRPRDGDAAWPVTYEQFAWLTAGLDWQGLTEQPAQGMDTDALYTPRDCDNPREMARVLHADLPRSRDAFPALTQRIRVPQEAMKLAK